MKLTRSQLRVARMVADGKSVKTVAAALERSVKTIEAHMYEIHRRLGIHNRAELVRWVMAQDAEGA